MKTNPVNFVHVWIAQASLHTLLHECAGLVARVAHVACTVGLSCSTCMLCSACAHACISKLLPLEASISVPLLCGRRAANHEVNDIAELVLLVATQVSDILTTLPRRADTEMRFLKHVHVLSPSRRFALLLGKLPTPKCQ